jgi:hypothetical protein
LEISHEKHEFVRRCAILSAISVFAQQGNTQPAGVDQPDTAALMQKIRDNGSQEVQGSTEKAELPNSLVLYCARHAFGTAAYEATGNLAMVMKVMGHTDVRTSRYQHPLLDSIREASTSAIYVTIHVTVS